MSSPQVTWDDEATKPPQVQWDAPQRPATPPQQPGMMERGWNAINRPLISEGPAEHNAHRYADDPNPSEFEIKHPVIGGVARGLAGAGADTLQTIRGFTSPLSIGMLGLGAAGKAPGAIGTIAKAGAGLTGATIAGVGAHGLATDDGSGNIADKTQRVLGHAAQVTGGIAGAAEPLHGSSPKLASAINNRVIGTSKRGFSFDRDPGLTVAKEGIVGNSAKVLQNNIQTRIGGLETQKQNELIGSPKKFNAEPLVRTPIAAKMGEAQASGNPELFNSYDKIRGELTGKFMPSAQDIRTREPIAPLVRVGDKDLSSLNASGLNNLKKDIGERANWQQYGLAYKKPLNALKGEMYHGIDTTLDSAIPNYKSINDTQSNLIAAKDDLSGTIARSKKNALFGLKDAYTTGIGMAGGAALHPDPVTPIIAGLGMYAANRAIGSPAVLTRTARVLANPSGLKPGIATVPASIASAGSRPIIALPSQSDDDKDKNKRNGGK